MGANFMLHLAIHCNCDMSVVLHRLRFSARSRVVTSLQSGDLFVALLVGTVG